MLYQISRNGQMYGPYTLDDLRRYVASGNVLQTDLAKTDEMPDWLPVSEILSSAPATPPTQSAAGEAVYAPLAATPVAVPPTTTAPSGVYAYPNPPGLNWILLLLLGFFTCGFFLFIYEMIQASWLRKIFPNSRVLFFYIAFIVVEVVSIFIQFGRMAFLFGTLAHNPPNPNFGVVFPTGFFLTFFISIILSITTIVLFIEARFTMRDELVAHYNSGEPVGLKLDPAMTFFFGAIYFQFHFNRITAIKEMARYGVPSGY
ncbi:protein of unknown function [Granulicella rosea]|uniref:GYF domain-containing protein n=1 Tax=Granulicella rosea TaxID=474952 RepID=A0A239CST6_9BACT|nr:DUF4339 domain-containing protein [Granulicella rosea]SNS23235.1 protein of unknown function [Granulicella rosea]